LTVGLRIPKHLCASVSEERGERRVGTRKRYLCCQIRNGTSISMYNRGGSHIDGCVPCNTEAPVCKCE
jgi:hypothetical protein